MTTPGTKETIVPDRRGHRHMAPSPKVQPFLKQRLGKRERLLSDGCLPRTTVQLCRGERCFPLLNTCWDHLWSIQACGILLPFLCCLDCPYLSSCILPQAGSGTALDFYNWRAESLHFLSLRGQRSLRCLCEVKGHTRTNALVSGGSFSCAFSVEASLDSLSEGCL